MKRLLAGILTAILAVVMLVSPVLAIALPDSAPTVSSIHVFQNVLETGDNLFVIYENTPYAATPATIYSSAFIWRLIDTDGTTELAQALGNSYHASGYGYNVISFYLDAGNVTAKGMAWGDALFVRLSGTPTAFTTPPVYTFNVVASNYSNEIATADVKQDIALLLITIAEDLNTQWGLTTTNQLTYQAESGTVLSPEGQSLFRSAIYGVQAMAPSAFDIIIGDIDTTPRTWTNAYTTNLSAMHSGDYIGAALTAGNSILDVSYNLFGLLAVLALCALLIGIHWWLAGGMIWRSLIECAAVLVICARMGLWGLGELALVEACCWIYVSAKLWRMV